MRNTVRKGGILFLSVIVALSVFAPSVFASSADVGIEPAYPRADNERTQSIFIMQLKPEESAKDGLHLVNSGKEAHTVEIYATDSSYSVDGSFSCRQHAEDVKDVGTWVKLDKTDVTLQAGEQVVVDFNVSVPKGTSPGEHDGCIAVQDKVNLPATSGSGVLLGFRSAVRLAVTVPGKIIKKLDIVRVEIKHVANRGVSVSSIARNSGNVSLDVTARAQLVSLFGQESAVKSDATYPIMQGSTTGWAYVFNGAYWGGIYKARTSLSYNADPNAGLGQGTSSQQRVRKDSGWFVVLPDPLAAVAELAAVGAVIWLIATPIRRRLHRRYVIKNWQKHIVGEGETLALIAKARGAKWKKIARQNHIKAPYIVEPGRTIMVPKQSTTTKKSKPKKRVKAVRSELDWLADEEQVPVEPVQQVTTVPPVERTPVAPVDVVEQPEQVGWQSPQQVAVYDSTDTPTSRVEQSRQPTSVNPLFPEPENADLPDWRDGASEDELRQFGVLGDSSSVPLLQDSWNIDEEVSDLKQDTSVVRKPRANTKSRASSDKKAPKKSTTRRSAKKK